jgi:predicted DNA-binding protein
MKDSLQRTTIFLTKEQHEGLRTLAFERRKSMSQLLREAVLEILEDAEDLESAQKIIKNNEELVSFEEYKSKRNTR